MAAFFAMDFLLPHKGVHPTWPVIACDQFTSEPDYWEKVEKLVNQSPSTLRLVYPEVWLGSDQEARIEKIHAAMDCYLESDLFKKFGHSFVYVERTLSTGKIRRGIVGVIDLEQYDYVPKTTKAIRATEKTVTSRIPARVAVRRGAALELSHVLLLADDPEDSLLGTLEKKKGTFETIYDVQLMLNGAHLVGRLVTGKAAEAFEAEIAAYESGRLTKDANALLYCVGDGNHSLASAKAAYEEIKSKIGEKAAASHPARFAMVELGNIHDDSLEFEPIHRLVTHINPEALLEKLKPFESTSGHRISWVAGETRGVITLDSKFGTLAVGALQGALDALLKESEAALDYIHGEDSLRRLASKEGSIGFLLPKIKKADFFKSIEIDGVLPRKTFSMGHAQDKRYYTEARVILARKS